MSEVYTEFNGSLLRLSDEAIVDFVGDVAMVKTIYEVDGLKDGGLREHANDLRQIVSELEERLSPDGIGNDYLWSKVVDLGLRGGTDGSKLIDAYMYMRVNRLLDVEFGPDETTTTQLLREIAIDEIKKVRCTGSNTVVKKLFNFSLSTVLIERFFGVNRRDLHPDIEKHVLKSAESGDIRNPALARVVSTLVAKSAQVVFQLDESFRVELFRENFDIFKDREMRTKAVKEVVVSWVENSEEGVADDDSEELTEVDAEIVEDDEIKAVGINFDNKKAACFIDKDEVGDVEQYKALREYMLGVMFPSRGQSIEAAKEICASCCVKGACLEFALKNGIKHGIWGGESERGRRSIRKTQREQAEDAMSN